MLSIKRESPVRFDASPRKSEERDNWTVVLEYEDEGEGPWLADLAHKVRWDLQDRRIDDLAPCNLAVPRQPGTCTLTDTIVINRMNRTQAAIYHLGEASPEMPTSIGYTDVTESTVFLALFGPNVFRIAEKLTNLDFRDPKKTPPFLLQGPVCRVPCQITTLEEAADESGGFLLTCSRGYAHSMAGALSSAGEAFGLRPAGEACFTRWMRNVQETT